MSATWRVLVVDDHEPFRQGVVRLLGLMSGVEVVGEAGDGLEAVRLCRTLVPDVVLMDLRMPRLDGVEATRRILEVAPGTGVVVLTMSEEDASVFAALKAGARGYLLKGANRSDVERTIQAVGSGQAVVGALMAQRLAGWFAGTEASRRGTAFPGLTERERDVLELVSRGLSNDEIATRLSLANKTVRNHVSNVLAKLQVADRAHAIARARDAGWGSTGT